MAVPSFAITVEKNTIQGLEITWQHMRPRDRNISTRGTFDLSWLRLCLRLLQERGSLGLHVRLPGNRIRTEEASLIATLLSLSTWQT